MFFSRWVHLKCGANDFACLMLTFLPEATFHNNDFTYFIIIVYFFHVYLAGMKVPAKLEKTELEFLAQIDYRHWLTLFLKVCAWLHAQTCCLNDLFMKQEEISMLLILIEWNFRSGLGIASSYKPVHRSRLKELHLITVLSVHVFNTQKVILDTVTSRAGIVGHPRNCFRG